MLYNSNKLLKLKNNNLIIINLLTNSNQKCNIKIDINSLNITLFKIMLTKSYKLNSNNNNGS